MGGGGFLGGDELFFPNLTRWTNSNSGIKPSAKDDLLQGDIAILNNQAPTHPGLPARSGALAKKRIPFGKRQEESKEGQARILHGVSRILFSLELLGCD